MMKKIWNEQIMRNYFTENSEFEEPEVGDASSIFTDFCRYFLKCSKGYHLGHLPPTCSIFLFLKFFYFYIFLQILFWSFLYSKPFWQRRVLYKHLVVFVVILHFIILTFKKWKIWNIYLICLNWWFGLFSLNFQANRDYVCVYSVTNCWCTIIEVSGRRSESDNQC